MRITWLACVLCLAAIPAWSQKIYIGAKAGGQVSSAFIEHTIFNINMNTTILPGANGGVFVRYLPKPGDTWLNSGIQLGINYVQKGWKQTFLNGQPSYAARMNYLVLPLEGMGYFGDRNKYFLSAGFHLEFLTDYSLDEEPEFDPNPTNDPSRDQKVGGADFYTYEPARDREVGYGARLSGGVFREMAIGTVQLEGFFSYSFSNFIDAGDLTTRTPDLSNHWLLGFTVGYMISFGKKDVE